MGNVMTSHFDPNGSLASLRTDGELNDAPGSAGNVRLAETAYLYDPVNRRTHVLSAWFDPQTQAPLNSGQTTQQVVYSTSSHVLQTIDENGHRNRQNKERHTRPWLDQQHGAEQHTEIHQRGQ